MFKLIGAVVVYGFALVGLLAAVEQIDSAIKLRGFQLKSDL